MPGTRLDARATAVMETDKVLAFTSFHSDAGRWQLNKNRANKLYSMLEDGKCYYA